ncbi:MULTISPECIES: metallophosphoesterase family protein [Catenuloplanes]|uniref:Calcineurin-like phosphoesterase domain-containing protein n=1 Tax=Catenuloplanes niger TaxID=587534 RepID=A0AAE3ZK30_9ACTN|nr:metallophosphoesterase [Catenuloplanes niger]MDR7321363.1 hypothetical protein [Catenuloplanes niger]
MRLIDTTPADLTTLRYRRARTGGGTESAGLPVQRLAVDALPPGCDGILITGDLQGVAASPRGGGDVLLGIALADWLPGWADAGLLPPPERLGVLLAGDLYSAPEADVRGASGDVTDVWLAFAAAGCRFVVGVAGNHDVVDAADVAAFGPEVALLDGAVVRPAGLTVGGVSGVIGNPSRPGRRTEPEFLRQLTGADAADVLILHEGPAGGTGQPGNGAVRARLANRPPALTVCGHVHWNDPVAALGDGHILNVDARAVVLGR